MKDFIKVTSLFNFFLAIFFFFIILMGMINIFSHDKNIYEKGYMDACNDFYNGNLKYKLIETEGKKIWKRK